jgi:drug/metabolite transporter (DMT)-like permease
MNEPPGKPTDRGREALGLLGFLLVATAQVSNMILARGVAGTVPPFAFFRWSIVVIGLLPAVVTALRSSPGLFRRQGLGIAAAGFLGMFICGGPVYVAGVTTSAINIALIMALSPLVVVVGARPYRSKTDRRNADFAIGRGADHHQGASGGRHRVGPR